MTDRFWRYFLKQPIWFALAVVGGLVLLPVAVWLDLRELSDNSLEAQAKDLNTIITDIRSYYSRNVVGRVIGHDGGTVAAHNYAGIDGAIPIPATLSIELGGVIGERAENVTYRFVSDLAFDDRPAHDLTAFEERALEQFRNRRDPDETVTEITGSLFNRKVQIAAPVIMGDSCLSCHNSRPDSPKRDWKSGDVRGLQAITIAQPITGNLFAFKYLLIYFAGAGALGAAFAGMQWRQASNFRQMNIELEAANEEISGLNQRLENENLRLGAELDIARQIQMMVLPTQSELGDISVVEIAASMEPADEVGGDYYDVLQTDTGFKVGIGDVTGHGLESGVLMLMVQSVALALQERGDTDPRQFLSTLNRAIFRNLERTGSDKHLTLSFLDYHDGRVKLYGQHEYVLLIRSDGTHEVIDTLDLGFPIGLDMEIADHIDTLDLKFTSGDVIVLHTDGITEAEDPSGTLFGLERLCESALRHRNLNAHEILSAIIADVQAHIGTQEVFDDITLVVMRHR